MAVCFMQVYQCMPNHAAGRADSVCQIGKCTLLMLPYQIQRPFAGQGSAVRSAGAACNRNGQCPFGYVFLLL